MKTVFDQMQEIGAAANIENFRVMQGWSYLQKVSHAEKVARTFYDRNRAEGRNVHVSVGGLDSITLHYFLEDIGVHAPCISCSTLEGKGVQIVHRQIRDEMARDYADWEACNGALPQVRSPVNSLLRSFKQKAPPDGRDRAGPKGEHSQRLTSIIQEVKQNASH